MSTDAIDWCTLLRANDQIVCSHMSSEPMALLRSLARAQTGIPFGVTLGVPFSDAAMSLPANVTLTTFGGVGSSRTSVRPRRISMVPYRRSGEVFTRGLERCDVALISLARSTGGWSLGASHGYILEAARRARVVVAEVNAQAPDIGGAPWPSDIAIHHIVETDYPLVTPAERTPSKIDSRIARLLADHIPEGACLQVGIGGFPSAVLAALSGHRGLGLHSGVMTDAVHALMLAGAMDQSCKPPDRRLAVTGSVFGSEELYRHCHRNPDILLQGPKHTHDTGVIASIPGFTAINSAIEVDLTGQVNAETVQREDGSLHYVGAIGGLNDFVRAAPLAEGGKSIIALPSRTRSGIGGRPRIVSRLSGPATVAAQDADIIATEHGVAQMRDRTLDARVRAMLAIADPSDRDQLAQEARARGLV